MTMKTEGPVTAALFDVDARVPSSRAAIAAMPGRPALRTWRAMASAVPATSKASRPVTVPASSSSTTVAAAAAV